MRIRILAVALCTVFALVGTAEAINQPYAVRQIKRYVKEDCHSYRGFDCLGWKVWACFKVTGFKVRCSSRQEYSHNGNWRECRFKTSADESRDHQWITLHFGRAECYSESGAPIP